MAEAEKKMTSGEEEKELSDIVRAELETMTSTERAAVITLLVGETQASDIFAISTRGRCRRLAQQWSA